MKLYTFTTKYAIIKVLRVEVLRLNNINEPWISTKDIAQHLGVTTTTIHKWIKTGNIPCSKVGKLWKFKKTEVDEWVKSGEAGEE